MSHLQIVIDRDGVEEAGRRQLLAVHDLRRNVEPDSIALECDAIPVAQLASMTIMRAGPVRELRELIAALDRRVPQVQRAGETSIAREALALKNRALKRLAELEHESP